MINNFDYIQYKSLVKTKIYKDKTNYIYKQEFIIVKQTKNLKKEDFLELIRTLKYFESIKFIHGDLNKKNIIYTNDGFKIIDYEPSLFQIKNNRQQLMVTIPYVLKADLESKSVTISTDKLGFFYFILRINRYLTDTDIVSLSKNLNHKKYIRINEEELELISYEKLLDKAFKVIDRKKKLMKEYESKWVIDEKIN